MLTKLQYVAEHLDQIGVKLPEEGEEEAAATAPAGLSQKEKVIILGHGVE